MPGEGAVAELKLPGRDRDLDTGVGSGVYFAKKGLNFFRLFRTNTPKFRIEFRGALDYFSKISRISLDMTGDEPYTYTYWLAL